MFTPSARPVRPPVLPSYRLISIANLTCSRTGGPILAQSLAYAPPFESLEACRLLRPSLQGAWKRQAQQILADLSALFSPASVCSRCTAICCQHVLELTGRRRVQAQPTRPGGSAHSTFPQRPFSSWPDIIYVLNLICRLLSSPVNARLYSVLTKSFSTGPCSGLAQCSGFSFEDVQ